MQLETPEAFPAAPPRPDEGNSLRLLGLALGIASLGLVLRAVLERRAAERVGDSPGAR